jgi:hypothetical protein
MNSPLKNFLSKLQPGPIDDTTALEPLLEQEWDSINDSDFGGMQAYKLIGRLEKVQWQSPYLTFSIERHGATVNGSTRAELQTWQVDITRWTAQIVSTGRRQLYRTTKRLDVREPVKRIADAILNNLESPSLKRYPDGRVKVLIGTIIPPDGYQQTVAGRRKRFRALLEKLLAERGWFPAAINTYVQKPLSLLLSTRQ